MSTKKNTPNIGTQLDAGKDLPAPRTPLQVETQAEREVRETAEAIIKKTGEVAGLYLSLCLNIRQNKVAPTVVGRILKDLGFHRVRISEINKVANAPDDVFTNYQARAIGFNKALEFARVENESVVETPVARMLKDAPISPMSADEVNEAISEDDGKPEKEKKKTSNAKQLDRVAAMFFKLCRKGNKKTGVWKSGDGLKIVLSKDDMPQTASK